MKVTFENVNNAMRVMEQLVAWADDTTGSTTVPIALARKTLTDMKSDAGDDLPADDNVKVYFKNRKFYAVPVHSGLDLASEKEA